MYELFSPRVERLLGGYLITNDCGDYVILNSADYQRFKTGNLDGELHQVLEKKGIIVTNSNRHKLVNKYRFSKRQLLQGPCLHIIIPTRRCNQSCVYCHAPTVSQNESGYDMDIPTAKAVVDFIFKSPSKSISIEFQGGEPLLNFKVMKYITGYAREVSNRRLKMLRISFTTNLLAMDKEKMDFIIQNWVLPGTSLDGPKELHSKNRPGDFAVMEKWIKTLMKVTEHRLSAIATITSNNVGFPEKIVDEYLRLGFRKFWVRPFDRLGRGCDNAGVLGITPEQYFTFWKRLLTYIVTKKKPISEIGTNLMVQKAILGLNPMLTELQSPCGAVINQLAYDYNGDIYSCDEARMAGDMFRLGNVFQGYKEIVSSDSVRGLIKCSINDVLACQRCAFKPFCGVCPVISYVTTGSPITKTQTFQCKLRKAQFKWLFETYFSKPRFKEVFNSWAKTKDL